MKVFFKERELELWQGAHGSDLLTPEEQAEVEAGDLALWEEHDGWVGLGGALRNNGKYKLMDAKPARLRLLPSVDRLLANPVFEGILHQSALLAIRKVLDGLRDEICNGAKIVPQMESIIKAILLKLGEAQKAHWNNTPTWMNLQVRLLDDPFASLSQALLAISDKGSLALPRQQLIENDGQRVENFILRVGWSVMPLGTINRCNLADFQAALNAGVHAMAFLCPDNYSLRGFTVNVKPEEIARLALLANIRFLYYSGNLGLSIA